jgi:hypothetical protein
VGLDVAAAYLETSALILLALDLSLSCSNGLCNLRLYTADGPCLEQLVSKVVKFTQLLGHNTIFAALGK